MKLELKYQEKGLTHHEFRLALVDLLQRDLWITYAPKKVKQATEK